MRIAIWGHPLTWLRPRPEKISFAPVRIKNTTLSKAIRLPVAHLPSEEPERLHWRCFPYDGECTRGDDTAPQKGSQHRTSLLGNNRTKAAH